MAQLVVRNIEDAVKERLKHRAARHGRSLEAEVREILREAAKQGGPTRTGLGTEFVAAFKGIGLDRPIPELRGFAIERPDFDSDHS